MSDNNVRQAEMVSQFVDGGTLWTRLDRLSRSILGVTAPEFVAGLRVGRFRDSAIAGDLAALVPFAQRPE